MDAGHLNTPRQHDQHEHSRGHPHGHGGKLAHLLKPHSHRTADKVDKSLESSAEGMRALTRGLVGLGITAAAQGVVAALSGSVALLGDSLHNAADALTAVPLAVAFILSRRLPTARFTYGYGRAEDLAGVAVVLVIALSSVAAAFEAVSRMVHPRPVSHLAAVAGAAVLGFTGNELVARYRIRAGRRIGSAALVADGLHARADGFTSLAVLAGAGGVALGWNWADPAVGLAITAAIAVAAWQAAREVGGRLMDSVDPALTEAARAALRATPGVLAVGQVRLRWVGHRLRGECEVQVAPACTAIQAHHVTTRAEHALSHALPKLASAIVHADPYPAAAHHPALGSLETGRNGHIASPGRVAPG